MYRIRRESGEEVSLGSIDEFGAAVAAGIVTAKAEIFHARAEKWLPIASHPHFKMAHDRVTASGQKPSPRNPAVTASGQRPALGASGQRPSVTVPQPGAPTTASDTTPRQTAPQLRVMRTETAPSPAPADAAVTQKPAPRWNTGQRPAARAVAPKPSTASAPPASDLRLLRADTLLSSAATAPALPEIEFELLPELEAPEVIEPVAAAPVVIEPVAQEPVPVQHEYVAEAPVVARTTETVVEHSPANVELVSHEEKPAASRGEVEIINPDRSMPVVSNRDVSSLEIPSPIRDFAPAEPVAQPVARPSSKAPLFVGLGLVAAAAAVIGFFVLKPGDAAPAAPAAQPAPVQSAPAPVAVVQVPAPAPETPEVTTKAPTGASTGLGGDVPARKPKKSDDAKATIDDGLEPPPEVLPAAPTLGRLGDDAALPTVDPGGARNDAMDREKALERTRRQIDSSMRR